MSEMSEVVGTAGFVMMMDTSLSLGNAAIIGILI
jgi:hypothetical protein